MISPPLDLFHTQTPSPIPPPIPARTAEVTASGRRWGRGVRGRGAGSRPGDAWSPAGIAWRFSPRAAGASAVTDRPGGSSRLRVKCVLVSEAGRGPGPRRPGGKGSTRHRLSPGQRRVLLDTAGAALSGAILVVTARVLAEGRRATRGASRGPAPAALRGRHGPRALLRSQFHPFLTLGDRRTVSGRAGADRAGAFTPHWG